MADRLAQIQVRATAATPGPWFWCGNVDQGDPRLVARGREVLGHVPRERTADDPAAKDYAHFLREEVQVPDGQGGWRHYTDAEIAERVCEDYVQDAFGSPRRDPRLAFVTEQRRYIEARELAIFEVARAQGLPDDTPRQHPKVYRADIVGLRHPDAEFLAGSREDVDWLLGEVHRLHNHARTVLTELRTLLASVDTVADPANDAWHRAEAAGRREVWRLVHAFADELAARTPGDSTTQEGTG